MKKQYIKPTSTVYQVGLQSNCAGPGGLLTPSSTIPGQIEADLDDKVEEDVDDSRKARRYNSTNIWEEYE